MTQNETVARNEALAQEFTLWLTAHNLPDSLGYLIAFNNLLDYMKTCTGNDERLEHLFKVTNRLRLGETDEEAPAVKGLVDKQRNAKRNLEVDITKLLLKFREDTGLNVTDIDTHYIDASNLSGPSAQHILARVIVRAELP